LALLKHRPRYDAFQKRTRFELDGTPFRVVEPMLPWFLHAIQVTGQERRSRRTPNSILLDAAIEEECSVS